MYNFSMYLLIFIIFIALLLIYNNTGIFYRESSVLPEDLSNELMEKAEPVVKKQGHKKAILFIHGFPGTPWMYSRVKERASEEFDIFIPLLPGFGRTPKEFVKTGFSMWYASVRKLYLEHREEYEEFYIVGNSMGGSLGLKLAEEFSSDPSLAPFALAAVAPPVFLNRIRSGVMKTPLLYFMRTFACFIKHIPRNPHELKRKKDQDGSLSWVGYYDKFPLQTYSLLRGIRGIRKELHRVTVPCYLSHARGDRTVSFQNLFYIADKVKSDNVRMRIWDLHPWKHSHHSLFIYKSVAPVLIEDILDFFSKVSESSAENMS